MTTTIPVTESHFQATDPMTNESVEVPIFLKGFINNVIRFNKKIGKQETADSITDLQSEFDKVKEENDNLKKSLEDGKNGDGKKIELLKTEYDKSLKEKTDLIEKLTKSQADWKVKFEDKQILSDIHKALGKYDLYNSDQTVNLLRQTGQAQLVEKIDLGTGQGTGIFETKLKLSLADENGVVKMVELNPEIAAEKFLGLEENSFHLKNKLSSGGGSKAGNILIPKNDLETQYVEAMKSGDVNKAIALKEQMK